MKILGLEVYDYRNYKTASLNFDKNLNVLKGDNAQGKTNLCEAIYFFAIGRSTRTNKEKEVINFEKDKAKITLLFEKKFTKRKIEIIFSKTKKKTILINGIPIKKMGELLGEFNAVYFSPDELKLIKESPEERRRFMDMDISQTSKNYFYNLSRYEKILMSRNKLLKEEFNKDIIKETLPIWNEQLASIGAKIIVERIKFLDSLSKYAKLAHEYLSSNKEELVLEYQGVKENTYEEIKNELLKKLEKNIEKDISLGYTTVGPHRDDIKILLNNVEVKSFGSQGQKRTAALSMKLAELEIIKNQTGELPILILDDVFSELDKSRREKLLNFCKKTQTIISTNDFEEKVKAKCFTIQNGQVYN